MVNLNECTVISSYPLVQYPTFYSDYSYNLKKETNVL